MGDIWFWFKARLSAIFRKKVAPPAPVIVGQAYLDNYSAEWARLQDRFIGYVRANPDGATMLKALSVEEISRMAADSQPLFPIAAPRKSI